jgi:hypothetical protein
MADLGALFIDIFSRFNLPSAERAARDAIGVWKKAGEDCSRSFSETTAVIGQDFKVQFDEIVQTAEAAYREMEIGFRDLQQKEMEINNLRLQGFRYTSDEMLAVQREYEAKMLESQGRIAEAQRLSDARIAAVAPDRSGGRHEEEEEVGSRRGGRGVPIPIPRGANIAGWGALLGGATFVGESVRSAAEMQNTLNTLASLQHESQANINLITQAVYQQAAETGVNRQEIAKMYLTAETATNQTTGKPYRGQDAIDIVTNALKLSRITGGRISNEEALQGTTTTMHDYRVGPEGSAGVAGMLGAFISEFKGNPDEAMRSLHSVEPSAMLSNIKPEEIFAALGLASQTGASGQQSAVNINNIIKSLAKPNSVTAKALSQLKLNPEDLGLELSKKGLAGTMQELQQALAQNMDPQGNIYLGVMAQNELMKQQQKEVYDRMSPVAQAFVNTEDVQKSAISPFKAKTLLQKADEIPNLSENDIPLITEYIKQQQALEGPSTFLKRNIPLTENIRAAVGQMFNTSDASNIAMILGLGSPGGLKQFEDRTAGIKAGANPSAFEAAFKQGMDSDLQRWHTLGQSAGNLATRFGHDLLPTIEHVINGLKDMADFLNRHKTVANALLDVLGDVVLLWGAAKTINFFAGIQESFGKLSGSANKAAAGAKILTAAEETAAAEITESRLGPNVKAAGTAAEGLAAAEGKTAAAVVEGGAGIKGGFAGVVGKLGILGLAVQMLSDFFGGLLGDPDAFIHGITAIPQVLTGHRPDGSPVPWVAPGGSPLAPGAGVGNGIAGRPGADIAAQGGLSGIPMGPGAQGWSGNARGGIVGYDVGGEVFAGLSSHHGRGTIASGLRAGMGQPLMGVPDTGGDSVLGMLPNGQAVGLRGGEGILTPETVQALGGEAGVNALNANPWSNPFHVATSMYGSFARGVAKYSPWGKYLTASSQTLDSLEQEFSNSTSEHMGHRGRLNRGGMPYEVEQMLASGMSPEEIEQALGVSAGRRGGLYTSDGRTLPPKVREMLGLPPAPHRGSPYGERTPGGGTVGVPGSMPVGPGAERWRGLVTQIVRQRGMSDSWITPLLGQITTESGGDPHSINDHDPNGRGGIQTVEGLFNFLPSTFAGAGGGDIWNPTDQINNAITYGLTKPGSTRQQPQGFGYGQGWARGGVVGFDVGGTVPLAPPPPPPPNPPDRGAQVVPSQRPPQQYHTYKPPSDDHPIRPDQHLGTAAGHHEPPPHQFEHPDRNIKENPSQPLTAEGKGLGFGGGLIGAAESAASMAANAFAPGSGQVAQQLFQLANLAVGYGGQLVGIGIEGLMSTFLPNDSPAADPSKNIFGKMALGIAGAHKGPNNMAGSSAMQLNPKQDLDQGAMAAKQVMPGINIHGDIHNHHDQEWDGMHRAVQTAVNMSPGLNAKF